MASTGNAAAKENSFNLKLAQLSTLRGESFGQSGWSNAGRHFRANSAHQTGRIAKAHGIPLAKSSLVVRSLITAAVQTCMAYDRDVQELIDQANSYASLACGKLIRRGHIPSEGAMIGELEQGAFFSQLAIHFLFPQLTPAQREMLTGVWLSRRAMQLLISTDRGELKGKDRTEHEKATNEAEQTFMASKDVFLQTGAWEYLSDTQRRILAQYYFRTDFTEPPAK